MLFLTYWEINRRIDLKKRAELASKVMEKGLWPPKGTKLIRWDITSDGWGITILEADSAEDVFRGIMAWTETGIPDFFTVIKTAPVLPIEKAIPLLAEF